MRRRLGVGRGQRYRGSGPCGRRLTSGESSERPVPVHLFRNVYLLETKKEDSSADIDSDGGGGGGGEGVGLARAPPGEEV